MKKIFVIEDDPLMVNIYNNILRPAAGYEIEIVSDAENAIARLESMEVKPLVIILDIMVKDLSGLDILRHIKEDPKLKDTPVVVVSSAAGESDIEKALRLGAVLYLVKNQYDPKELVGKIDEIIKGYSDARKVPEVKVRVKGPEHEQK